MRFIALLAVLIALAAPVAAGAAQQPSHGVLYGVVTRGPACSKGQPQPCAGPIAGVKIAFIHHGHPFAEATTNNMGAYRIRLRAGRYGIQLPGHEHVQPTHVRVHGGQTTRLNIAFDTLNG